MGQWEAKRLEGGTSHKKSRGRPFERPRALQPKLTEGMLARAYRAYVIDVKCYFENGVDFERLMPQRVSLAESALGGLIVSETDPKSLAAQEMKNLTEELLAFYGKKDGSNPE